MLWWGVLATLSDAARHEETQVEVSDRPLMARFIDDVAAGSSDASTFMSASFVPSTPDSITAAPPPQIDAVASDSFEQARFVTTAVDAAEVARLQGIYRSQLLARLARLFEARNFSAGVLRDCSINVIQDDHGQVLDVMTDLCGLGEAEQEMVRQVVRGASPLPLPPLGLAAGSYLTLDLSELQLDVSVR
jgi:hypothetical protein